MEVRRVLTCFSVEEGEVASVLVETAKDWERA